MVSRVKYTYFPLTHIPELIQYSPNLYVMYRYRQTALFHCGWYVIPSSQTPETLTSSRSPG